MTMISKVLASGAPFFSNCVTWPEEYLDALQRIRDKGHDIDREEFLAAVNWSLYKAPNDFIPEDDWLISYKKYENIYFFIHSGIEYVFAEPSKIKELQDLIDREDMDPESDEFTYDFYVKSEKETTGQKARAFLESRRKLVQLTESRSLVKKALQDHDPEIMRIAKKRMENEFSGQSQM